MTPRTVAAVAAVVVPLLSCSASSSASERTAPGADSAHADGLVAALPPPRAVTTDHFATSLVCAQCHSADPSGRATALLDAQGRSVGPFELWQTSMMGNAARDPLFRAKLSTEVAAQPAHAKEIEAECLHCHAPMAAHELEATGGELRLSVVHAQSAVGDLARDGVSCALCHRIAAEGLGSPETYSGHYQLGPPGVAYGPYAQPFTRPMEMHTGFRPTYGAQVREAALCGSCHTLFTPSVVAGERVPEQATFLEWKASAFASASSGTTCQGCHLPERDADGEAIRTRIARRPGGGDFPPLAPRSPFGRHTLVGGNTRMLAVLRDNPTELSPIAPPEAFDAAILETRLMLARAASLELSAPSFEAGTLRFSTRVTNLSGHKLPTGYPSRRIWLRVQAFDASGVRVAQSGVFDVQGRLLDGAGQVLAAELAGGPVLPHRSEVRAPGEVALWESVLEGEPGQPTFLLLAARGFLKDDRLLPRGYAAEHPEAVHTRPVGTASDADFVGGADTVQFALPVGARPARVVVELFYQPVSPRFAAELFTFDTDEVQWLQPRLERSSALPELLASATATLGP